VLRLSLRMTLARWGRLVLTSLAVILGTAFLSGTFVFRDTINRTFDDLFSDVFRDVDAYVRSTSFVETRFGGEQRGPTPVSVLETVRAVPGVVSATGDMQAFARVIGKDGEPLGSEGNGPPTFGGIASDEVVGLWNVESGRLPAGPTEVMLDRATAEEGGFAIGDTVRVTASTGTREFTLVGVANYGDIAAPGGATFALFDPVTASEFLLRPGFVDAILVQGDGSLDDAALADRIDAALPADARLETLTGAEITAEVQGQIKDVLSIFTTFLIAFSWIALGIGAFVIYNVFSISAAQRQRESALMRAIGASRRQVTGLLVGESFVVGVVGSCLGFGLGILLSQGLAAVLAATGFEIPSRGLSIGVRTFAITFVAGLVVTMVSAVLPALRAGRVAPLAAMRDSAIETVGHSRRRVVIAVMIAALGVAGLVAAANDAPVSVLGLGILGVFGGVLVAGPVLARPVALTLGRPVARLRGVTGAMARQNAARNPKRTARTASPVLIGVALVTAFTALAASIRTEIRDTLGAAFRGDLALTVESQGFGGIPTSVTDSINDLPEVDVATGVGFTALRLGDESRFAVVVDPATIPGLYDLGVVEGDQASLSATGVFVALDKATELGLGVGDALAVATPDGRSVDATVEGIFDSDSVFSNYVVSRAFFEGTTTPVFDNFVYVRVADGVTQDRATAAVAAVSSDLGIGTLQTKDEFIEAQSGSVNQLLALIYALLGLSIIIAIVGIVITLLLSVLERRREIGLLRAVGMTKSQVRTSVRWESVITSLFGAVTGVVLGIGMGVVIVATLSDSGVAGFTLPLTATGWILVVAFFAGVAAAVYPAWRATRVDVIESIATT
jgi:putative ABC transport system permease protein